MGKKSKRRCNKKKTTAGAATTTEDTEADLLQQSIDQLAISNYEKPPSDAACWICLDQHDSGMSIERNCSCRGGSGFVHLSCYTKYAEEETKKRFARFSNARSFTSEDEEDEEYVAEELAKMEAELLDAWGKCPTCHQFFLGKFSIDLWSRCAAFVKDYNPDSVGLYVRALTSKLTSMTNTYSTEDTWRLVHNNEATRIANELLSLYKEMKGSDEVNPNLILQKEGLVYECLANFSMGEARRNNKKESGKFAEEYFAKARDKYKEVQGDLSFKIASMERSVFVARREYCKERESTETALKRSRDLYDKAISSHGKESLNAIVAGEQLVASLHIAHRGIESQRLITELYTICQRIYGLNHPTTKQVMKHKENATVREVGLPQPDGTTRNFQALRYINDKTVLLLDIGSNLDVQLSVPSNSICIKDGTPVLIRGIPDDYEQSYLNGKIGDLRPVGDEGEYKIYFEDASLEPAKVYTDYIQILFDELPPKER